MIRQAEVTYLELGTEVFIFQVNEDLYCRICDDGLWSDKTKYNFLLTNPSKKELHVLAALITQNKDTWVQKGYCKVNVYSPVPEVQQYLDLQDVKKEWYNFFINLWDELNVDGIEKLAEYTFIEVMQGEKNSERYEFGQYAIELFVPDTFLVCYSDGVDSTVFERTAVYSDIYIKIHSLEEYQHLVKLTEGFRSRRGKIHLILQGNETQECNIIEDGFCKVAKEK